MMTVAVDWVDADDGQGVRVGSHSCGLEFNNGLDISDGLSRGEIGDFLFSIFFWGGGLVEWGSL